MITATDTVTRGTKVRFTGQAIADFGTRREDAPDMTVDNVLPNGRINVSYPFGGHVQRRTYSRNDLEIVPAPAPLDDAIDVDIVEDDDPPFVRILLTRAQAAALATTIALDVDLDYVRAGADEPGRASFLAVLRDQIRNTLG